MSTSNPLLVLGADGTPHIEPSVSSVWTFDETSVTRYIAQHDVVLLSWMEGGSAGILTPFIDTRSLQLTYDPENLHILGADLASYLKTPSFDANVRGAYRIYVLRLGKPTPASLTLLDAGSQPVMLLTSRDAGTYVNKISVEVGSGTIVGKRVTYRFRQERQMLDNLQNSLHISYTGNATLATITITRSGDKATRLQTALTGATDGSINLDLNLTQDAFATVQQLATYVSGQNGYSAGVDRFGAPLLPSTELDSVAGATIRDPVAFTIQYTGAGTAATLTTTDTTLSTTVTGASGQNLTIDLTDASTDTLGELVAAIDANANYSCTLGPNADPEAPTAPLLTHVTLQDIKTTLLPVRAQPGLMDYIASATLGSIIYATNLLVPRVSASRVTAAVNAPANRAQTFLAGGTNPTPTTSDWLDGLFVVEQEALAGGLMFPVSTDRVVQDATLAFCLEQRTDHGAAFRAFFGGPDGMSASDAKDMAMGLNSPYAAIQVQTIVAASGTIEQPPLYPAAMYCGAAAGALPTQSVTRLVLRAQALPERSKFSKAIREDLLANGVACLDDIKGVGVRLALAVTTSLSQDRINRILSETMAIDVIDQRIRAYVEPLIPHWAMVTFLPTVKGSVINALTTLETDGIISKGRDATGRILPAWLPVQVSIQAGIVKIVVHCYLGGEVDHILIYGTVSYQTFNIEIPASV